MMKRCLVYGFVCIVLLSVSEQAFAREKVYLASSERGPYIGRDLPNKGYVHELMTEAFQKAGYDVEIAFYPSARAILLADRGEKDGILPIYYESALEKDFVFSEPFPGGKIGLLKKKDFKVGYGVDPRDNQTEALRSLSRYSFGVVRGAVNTPEFDAADFLQKDPGTDDKMNLQKLFKDRIDFIVIDKYTAADLITHHLPHLIGQFEFMDPPLDEKPFHVAFSKTSAHCGQLVNAFNQGLHELQQDGTIENILSRHGLLETKESKPGKTTVRIGTVNNTEMLVMQRLSREFEQQHPEINLEWVVLDEKILRQRLLSDLAIADGKYDVITIGAYETPIWAAKGWLMPLTDIPASYDLDDVFESVRLGASYQGHLYALPFYAESTMTFYRKDLFKQAGLSMPDQPSYEDITRFASALHDPEHGVYGIGLRGKAGWGGNIAYISTLVNTYGGRWFDEQWQPQIDSPEWREALTLYVELLTKYGHPNRVTNGWQANQELFANGQLAILIDATSFAGRLFNPAYAKVYDRIGIAQAPIAKTLKGSHWLWAWSLAIPSSTQVPDEALQFITWATSKAYIDLIGQKEGWVSVPPGTRKSTYDNPVYRAEAPFADFVRDAIESADPTQATAKPVPYLGIQFVNIPEFAAIGTQVGNLMADALAGKLSIDAALKQAQKLSYEQMRESGYIR